MLKFFFDLVDGKTSTTRRVSLPSEKGVRGYAVMFAQPHV